MSSSQLFRFSGLALVVGAVTFSLHVVARSVLTAGPADATLVTGGAWVAVNAVGVLGSVLVLLGLPGMYARMSGSLGWPGFVGVVSVALAWMFFGGFVSLYAALVVPWVAEKAPALVAPAAPLPVGFVLTFILGLLALLVGTVLLAVPFVRGRARPRWIGYALPASALWLVIGDVLIAPSGPASNLAVNLLSNGGLVLFVVALGYLGFRMWSGLARATPAAR